MKQNINKEYENYINNIIEPLVYIFICKSKQWRLHKKTIRKSNKN